MPTGIGEELKSMGYGKDLANALASIGRQYRLGRLSQEASDTLTSLTGVDLNSPEGLNKFKSAILDLGKQQTSISENPAQDALSAAQSAIMAPQQFLSNLETQKVQRLKEIAGPYTADVKDLHDSYRIPGVDPNSLKERYNLALQRYNSLLPEFKGHENMLVAPAPPEAYRVDDKVGKVIRGDQYLGNQAPEGKAYQYLYSRGQDNKYGWQVVKDEDGNPILVDLPKGQGAQIQPVDKYEGDWSLYDPNSEWNQAFLDSLPIQTRGTVKAIAEGRANMQQFFSLMRGNDRAKYGAWVQAVNPRWREQNYQSMNQAQKSFAAGGKDYNNVLALNQATGHMYKLYQAALALDNADNRLWNKIANVGIRNITGDSRVDEFNRAATLVNEELAKAFGGKPGTIPELASLEESINSANSKQSMVNVMKESLDLLKTRFKAEIQGWVTSTGLPIGQFSIEHPVTHQQVLNILYPESRIALQKMGKGDLIDDIMGGVPNQDTQPANEWDKYKLPPR